MGRSILPMLVALAVVAVGCGHPGNGGRRAGPATDAGFQGLTLDLTPDPSFGVAVEVTLVGPRAEAVTELSVARAWGDTHGALAIADVRARDVEGDLALDAKPDGSGPDRVFALPRSPRGELRLRYNAKAGLDGSRFGLRVGGDRMTAVGHAFLLLPRVDEAIPTRVRFHLGALEPGSEGATSFGHGQSVDATTTTEELGHSVYAAGHLWIEEPVRPEDSGRSLVVLGNPPFDTRTAFDRSVTLLRATDRFFDREPPKTREAALADPFALLLMAEPGAGDVHDGASLTRSLGVWFDAARGFDSELAVVIAHEAVHRYLGGGLRLVDTEGHEALWFTEGFTVHFARKLLLEARLLSPREFLADVRRIDGDGAPDEAHGRDTRTRYRSYRHGAQIAAYFDAALRDRGTGEGSLEAVVRRLRTRAATRGLSNLPVSALRDAIEHALGAARAADLDRMLARPDDSIDLPADVFGPCFRRGLAEATTFDLGFDRQSFTESPSMIRGLVAGSAAARAGLHEGSLIVSAKVPTVEEALGRRAAEVDITVIERRGGRRIRYRPLKKRIEARWEVKACPGWP